MHDDTSRAKRTVYSFDPPAWVTPSEVPSGCPPPESMAARSATPAMPAGPCGPGTPAGPWLPRRALRASVEMSLTRMVPLAISLLWTALVRILAALTLLVRSWDGPTLLRGRVAAAYAPPPRAM